MSDVGLFLLLFAALCGVVALIRVFAWFTDVRDAGGPIAYARQVSGRYVKDNAEQPAYVMSRSELSSAGLSASAVQTDGRSDRQTASPAPLPRDVMLDICRDLRGHGYGREEARTLLRKLGQPLDNNVWSAAAPAPATEPRMLLVRDNGAAPRAVPLYDDPALNYESPPA